MADNCESPAPKGKHLASLSEKRDQNKVGLDYPTISLQLKSVHSECSLSSESKRSKQGDYGENPVSNEKNHCDKPDFRGQCVEGQPKSSSPRLNDEVEKTKNPNDSQVKSSHSKLNVSDNGNINVNNILNNANEKKSSKLQGLSEGEMADARHISAQSSQNPQLPNFLQVEAANANVPNDVSSATSASLVTPASGRRATAQEQQLLLNVKAEPQDDIKPFSYSSRMKLFPGTVTSRRERPTSKKGNSSTRADGEWCPLSGNNLKIYRPDKYGGFR
ncbi:hypothetical protein PoB_000398700 [Plakobranchus ocellatus]|uniref:Exophilin 5 n=1 Tax=Plakobranchus ocellatus TaxID=259542 RepID=A0AAV3Y5S8_9GAST|nr:hypothetical protein PoB_000398700 [Plakobranchus ocellatus]